MKIKRVQITEYYTAPNGDHVSITIDPSDTATLIICKPINNVLQFRRKYSSRRGAVIAMGKRCGRCEFNSMTNLFKKAE